MRGVRRWWSVVVATALAVSSATAAPVVRRVLFVGNSLTYVNNLPAAFASLAPVGDPVSVDAFAKPGASLRDDLGDPVLARLLAHGRYTDVVFQERGGNAVCMQSAATCQELVAAEHASEVLADAARAGGARVFYLGTWQVNPQVVPWLIRGERLVAEQMRAHYIPIGADWIALRARYPKESWVASDGEHPGPATTALLAVRVWQAVTGKSAVRPPCVGGTLYTHAPSKDGFFRVDPHGRPVTCLIPASLLPALLDRSSSVQHHRHIEPAHRR